MADRLATSAPDQNGGSANPAETERPDSILESIFATAPIGLAFYDTELRYVRINDKLAEINGLPVEAHLGKIPSDVLPGIRGVEQIMEQWREIIRTGQPVLNVEVSGETPAAPGELRSWLESWYPVRKGGQIIGIAAVVQEITERKQVEEAQRRLAEIGRVLAASLDYEATLQAVARLAVPFLADRCMVDVVEDGVPHRVAVACADPARHELAQQLLRFPPDAETDEGPSKVLRTGRSEIYPEVTEAMLPRFVRNQEHLQIVQQLGARAYMIVALRARERTLGVITFVSAESGRTYGAAELAGAEELASRAAMAIENARLYRQAQDAIQAREAFLAQTSHDLRNPLAAIRGYAQLLRRRGSYDDRMVGAIISQADQLARLVEDLVDAARLETGSLRLEVATLDLTAEVRAAAERAGQQTDRHRITLEVPSEPLPVQADRTRLGQVLANLLDNAVKYSPEGGEISVRAAVVGEMAHVAVRDQGLGIPAEALPRLFERAYRADAHAGAAQGLGLGLYIAKGIIEAHGGQIWAESEGEGRGSSFSFSIPRLNEAP